MSTLTKVLERNIKVIEKNADLTEGRFRLGHHLMPPVGWLNDPNGLCWYKGRYHVFFQYAPFDVEGGLKFWGHYTSEDLVDWKYEGTALYPDSPYDCHGVYSGSAFIENGTIHYFYTGNLKYFDRDDYDYINSGRGSNTITFTSKDGYNFTKKELLMTTNDYPDDMSNHVRDPKIFKKNDKYYMVLGARDKEGIGMILLYESADLKNWTYKNRITTPQKFGYMWECPDLFEIDGQLYIICCPQGVETQGIDYENVHQVTAMKLNYDFETDEYEITDIKLFDRGFDFYAPQSFEDERGRRILIGWMGIPDADYTNPTEEAGWQHALTIPRKLSVRDGKLIQEPIEELKQLRSNDKAVCTFSYGQALIMQNSIYEAVIDFKRCREMTMTLREGITLSYKDNILTLNLGFADTSSLEIFVNHGEEVFTTRIYNRHGRILINGECSGIMTVYPLKSFEIEGGRNEE